MASFSKRIKAKYELNTYEDTKATYEWIVNSLKKLTFANGAIEVGFQFDIGDINCSCYSLEEFTEYAYGQKDYELTVIDIIYRADDNIHIFINVSEYRGVCIRTDNKVCLEEIIRILETPDLKQSESITNNYIQNIYEIGSITGDNNAVVQGERSYITPTQKEKSKVKQWIEAILQNIVANWLWIVIPIIFAAIIGLLSNR